MCYGIVETSLEDKIEGLFKCREELVRLLPYADGGAYSQDKQRIQRIDEQLYILKQKLKESK